MEENKKHIWEELSKAPILGELKEKLSEEKKESYFDSLTERVLEKISISDELEEAPTLQQLQVDRPIDSPSLAEYFREKPQKIQDLLEEDELIGPESLLGKLKANRPEVPEGYFEQFPQKLPLTDETEESGKVISFQRKPIRWMSAIAAAVVLLIAGIWLIPQLHYSSSEISELSHDELLAVLEFEGYDSDDLLEVLGEDVMPFSVEVLEEGLSEEEQLEEVILNEIDFSDLDLGEYLGTE